MKSMVLGMKAMLRSLTPIDGEISLQSNFYEEPIFLPTFLYAKCSCTCPWGWTCHGNSPGLSLILARTTVFLKIFVHAVQVGRDTCSDTAIHDATPTAKVCGHVWSCRQGRVVVGGVLLATVPPFFVVRCVVHVFQCV